MFKKVLSSLLVITIMLLPIYSSFSVYAENNLLAYSKIPDATPNYNAITSLTNGIDIDTNGYVTYRGKTNAVGYTVAVYIELKQYINGDWVTIEDGYKSGNNTVLLTQYRWVDSGYLYCVKSTHYAYDSYGNLLDYVEKYSNSKYY